MRGAIPALGECYGLDMGVDDCIEDQPDIYFEGGDHATLVPMSGVQFAGLTATARHGSFSATTEQGCPRPSSGAGCYPGVTSAVPATVGFRRPPE